MPLFNFTLLPLDEVLPWGDNTLHWFGLTSGYYWMNVGEDKLFEYHPDNPWKTQVDLRFVDYYVARLYENIIQMTPVILDAIPSPLEQNVSGNGYDSYYRALDEWGGQNRYDCEHSKIYDAAMAFQFRILDGGPLTAEPKIRIWSDHNNVHIEWDNRECLVEGKTVWSAQQGAFLLGREDFIHEVCDFHDRLMKAMGERVDQVCAGALSPEIKVDFAELRREHESRSSSIEARFAPLAKPTDWETVGLATDIIKRWSAIPGPPLTESPLTDS